MKKEKNYTQYLEWAIMLVLFFGLFFVTIKYGNLDHFKPETRSGKVVMIIGIFIMMIVVLAAHELGHLITGLMNGFRFELFVVGPLGIRREEDKIKVYFNKSLAYFGGIAATSPVDDNHNANARKFAWILLAGPIASILFAIICYGLAYWVGKPLGVVFYTGALISIAIFFATTVPSRSGIFFTDRKRFQRLVTPGKDQDVELAMLRIMGQFSKDNSYKNIDQRDIDVMVSDDIPFIKYMGLFNKVCWQIEMDGKVDDQISLEYEEVSKSMSKNLVKAFDKEIEAYKEKFKAGSDSTTK